ncbi:hypothetical protein HYX15_02385 [Candidatus Woesearchaeota archaeon]|nr:hypothetical protein [Candidatus Woesearchaeota archaeon]
MKAKEIIKEIKCKCNQCGKIWHYLPSEKTSQTLTESGKDMIQASACCCNPIGILVGGLRQKQRELDECPNCNSKDVNKETIYYEKRK